MNPRAVTKKPELAAESGPTAFGFVNPPDIQVECEAFQGSLAMLFQCVRDRKIDLLSVPLAPICEAYFQYLIARSEEDIESAAAAMAALAYLLERKAWMLLPAPEEEPEESDLLDDVEPWVQEFAPVIKALDEMRAERNQFFFRPISRDDRDYEVPFQIGEATAEDLARSLEKLLAKAQPDPVDTPAAPRRSLADQMKIVLRKLPVEPAELVDLVDEPFTRIEAVWWFLALLELIRLGQAFVTAKEGTVLFGRRTAS